MTPTMTEFIMNFSGLLLFTRGMPQTESYTVVEPRSIKSGDCCWVLYFVGVSNAEYEVSGSQSSIAPYVPPFIVKTNLKVKIKFIKFKGSPS